MALHDDILRIGWHLSDEGIDLCKEELKNVSSSTVIQKALDTDLREIGAPFLADMLKKSNSEKISGPCVLQIQNIKNVASPKHETSNNAHILLKLRLTDGHSYISCIQWDSWKSINLNTPPGAKILIKADKVKVKDSFLLLKDNQFNLLGGHVASMVEKWELSKKFTSYCQRRNQESEEGPPPWIPFGQSINYNTSKFSTGNFRSLETDSKKEGKEDTAFKQQRMANIAEVSRSKEGKKKVFGGAKEVNLLENVENLTNSMHNLSTYSGKNSNVNNFDVRKEYNEYQGYKSSEKKSFKMSDTYPGRNKAESKNSSYDYSENRKYGDSNTVKEAAYNGAIRKGVIPTENVAHYTTPPLDVRKEYNEFQGYKSSEKKSFKMSDTYPGRNKAESKNSSYDYSENRKYGESNTVKKTAYDGAIGKEVIPKENIAHYTSPPLDRGNRSDIFYNSNISSRFPKPQERSNRNSNYASGNINSTFNQQNASNQYRTNSNYKKSDNAFSNCGPTSAYPDNSFLPREVNQQRGHYSDASEFRRGGGRQYSHRNEELQGYQLGRGSQYGPPWQQYYPSH